MKRDQKFKFGIEHEVALRANKFLDYRNLNSDILNKVVQKFPVYQSDYPFLRIGDLGIKVKRIYIEGLEIFDNKGYLIKQYPKGFELRTPLGYYLEEVVQHLYHNFQTLKEELFKFKMSPTFISFNPYLDKVRVKITLHKFEKKLRREDPGRKTAPFTLLSYGPDLNISYDELDDGDIFNIVQKLNHYTPFIIPFSFSSPFYRGKLWEGQSIRCFLRLKIRPAVVGFIKDEKLIKKLNNVWLLNKARIESEQGRIEYKAFDTVQDLKIYKGALALLKGLILDTKLNQKTIFLDQKLIEESSKYGFTSKIIFDGAYEMLHRAKEALKNDEDKFYLNYLFENLKSKQNLSIIMIKEYEQLKSVEKVLERHNNFIK